MRASFLREKVAKAVNRPHKDARIRLVDGRLEIEHDAFGIKLEEEKAIRAVSTHLSEGKFTVALPIVADKPRVTDRDAKQINTLLATFTTRFNAAKRDRTHNLILAAKSVDGLILKPDEQFSYNNVVGERLASRGYKDAPIFVKGKLEPGLGGGVCQVSSTIYNSVLLAGLKIKERYPHSRTVPYVKPGRDATVAYGYRDFRFENSNSSPVCLISRIGGGMLTIDVYGASQDKKSIELFTGDLSYTDVPGEEIVVDAALKSGQRKVVDKGARGVRVILYRKTTLADGSSVTEVVSKDRYPAQKKIVAISPVDRPKSTVIPASRNATGSAPAQIRQD